MKYYALEIQDYSCFATNCVIICRGTKEQAICWMANQINNCKNGEDVFLYEVELIEKVGELAELKGEGTYCSNKLGELKEEITQERYCIW